MNTHQQPEWFKVSYLTTNKELPEAKEGELRQDVSVQALSTHQQLSKKWEERFDNEFFGTERNRQRDNGHALIRTDAVKSFIQSLLTSHSQAIRERVNGLKRTEINDDYDGGYNHAVDDILALLTDEK